jgi:hypothetical protein
MADLERLFAAAARVPDADVDLIALEERAQVLRRHRALLVPAVVAGVVVVAVPAFLIDRRDTQGLTPVAPTSLVPSVVASHQPQLSPRSVAPGASPSAAAPGPSHLAGPVVASVGTSPTAVQPTYRSTATPSATGYPQQASCEVTTDGLTPGATRSCRFRATAAGGWRRRGQGGLGMGGGGYSVLVTRDGVTLVNPGDTGADCANDVIRPGDLVEIQVQQEQGYVIFRLGAGEGMRCGA